MDAGKLDEKILLELQLELRWMPGVDPESVVVKASEEPGVATLTGHVVDPSLRRVAEQVARRVIGVRSVVNHIHIHHPLSDAERESIVDGSVVDAFDRSQRRPD